MVGGIAFSLPSPEDEGLPQCLLRPTGSRRGRPGLRLPISGTAGQASSEEMPSGSGLEGPPLGEAATPTSPWGPAEGEEDTSVGVEKVTDQISRAPFSRLPATGAVSKRSLGHASSFRRSLRRLRHGYHSAGVAILAHLPSLFRSWVCFLFLLVFDRFHSQQMP